MGHAKYRVCAHRDGKCGVVDVAKYGVIDVAKYGVVDVAKCGVVNVAKYGVIDVAKCGVIDEAKYGVVDVAKDGPTGMTNMSPIQKWALSIETLIRARTKAAIVWHVSRKPARRRPALPQRSRRS